MGKSYLAFAMSALDRRRAPLERLRPVRNFLYRHRAVYSVHCLRFLSTLNEMMLPGTRYRRWRRIVGPVGLR